MQSEKRKRRVGQGVKTLPFHGRVTGSIPVRGTRKVEEPLIIERFFYKENFNNRVIEKLFIDFYQLIQDHI